MVPIVTIIIGICGVIFFGINVNKPRALEPVAGNSVSAPIVKQVKKSNPVKTLPRSQPTRLRIPEINVDTPLVVLDRKTDGTMQTPTDFFTAGWYKYSPTPGELGPSIITGHVDSYGGLAVFWRLRELQVNDTLNIERADGSTVEFRVDKVSQYPKNNFPTTAVYGDINYAGIRLITCGGIYDYQARDYTDNLVVFGSLVN
jgi:sortase (surface protein transpeptidase)